jgi:hypothetical protein
MPKTSEEALLLIEVIISAVSMTAGAAIGIAHAAADHGEVLVTYPLAFGLILLMLGTYGLGLATAYTMRDR